MVTCLLNFSRFQKCDLRERLESYSLSLLSSPTEHSRKCMELLKLTSWIGKPRNEGIITFDIGVRCVQYSDRRLALHLMEFFPSTVGRSLEFVVVKNLAKNLELKTTTINEPRGELNFAFIWRNRNVDIYSFV